MKQEIYNYQNRFNLVGTITKKRQRKITIYFWRRWIRNEWENIMSKINWEQVSMNLITESGQAKSAAMIEMRAARKNDFEKAEEKNLILKYYFYMLKINYSQHKQLLL